MPLPLFDKTKAENLRKFLMRPAPKEAKVVQCYIKRTKSGFLSGRNMYPTYRVYMKVSSGHPCDTATMEDATNFDISSCLETCVIFTFCLLCRPLGRMARIFS